MISFFFFNDTATTEIYTLSLHDALPILLLLFQYSTSRLYDPKTRSRTTSGDVYSAPILGASRSEEPRLNSSHLVISYAVFCLKKKNIPLIRLRALTLNCRPGNTRCCS